MASSGGARTSRKQREICVREELKIAVQIALDRFRFDEKQKVLEFPSSFTSVERAYVHRMCENLGLRSKSRGNGSNRFLTVTKKDINIACCSSILKLSSHALQQIDLLSKKFPLNMKERQELQPKKERSTVNFDTGRSTRDNKIVGKLNGNTPLVPPGVRETELTAFRKSLPIYDLREQIIKLISENQVILISGETGSGKTTQVPQFILEHATAHSNPCRLVCTQPRRLSAMSVSERVATERGERLGQTVGYQIRLENRISPKTLLTYCTTGVLLRTLMSGDNSLSFITHVIVDEIHERDRFTDFLLIALRDLLALNRRLKVILMSAALDINLFIEYFGKCPVIHVPGRCYEVKSYFLEDVLKMTSYCNKEMAKHMKDKKEQKADQADQKEKQQTQELEKSLPSKEDSTAAGNGGRLNGVKNVKKVSDGSTGEHYTIEEPGSLADSEADNVFEEVLQSAGGSADNDSERKIVEDSQEKDYLPDFQLDEELAEREDLEGTSPEEDQDIFKLLEGEDDGENEDGDDEEEEPDDEEVDDEEEDEGDVKELEEGIEIIKMEDETEEESADASENNNFGDKEGDEEDEEQEIDSEEQYLKKEMDDSISEAWLNGDEEPFVQILYLVMHENISVDYQHSETQATALMVASGRGCVGVVEQLLSLGANPHIREPKNGWTALDWAKKWEHSDVIELLESNMTAPKVPYVDETVLEKESKELSEESKELLSMYHKTFDDERVDLDLIVSLLLYICGLNREGAILVFLPGYDEIITLRDHLLADKEFCNSRRYQIYTLHSSMQPSEQRKVFRKPPPAMRKIILSTNIAETSITIDDVVFVIDSGKVKEKSYDALTSVSTLHPVWVSKASAIQRRGRAGRCSPGVCFHLLSQVRFESLLEYQIPDLLRTPLQELCLHTKLLASPNMSIIDFLCKAPEAPPFLVLRNAITLLKTIDALDQWEDLTDLGHHLADLPLSPQLGKMILYSVVLKCLDPVVTIVCALAYRDPFILPMHPFEKRAAAAARKRFIMDPFSDHLIFVKVFRGWQRARSEGVDRNYCQRNYLSQATLEMMAGMRSQILGHLKVAGFIRARGAGDIRDLNSNSTNWAVIKAAVCAGSYPQVARVDRATKKLTTQKEKKARLHSSSILCQHVTHGESVNNAQIKSIDKLPTDWLIYEDMTRLYTTVSVKCCTVVTPITIALVTGPSLSSEHVTQDPTAARDGDRHGGEGLGRDSESSGSDVEEKTGKKNGNSGFTFKVDEWIALSGNQDVVKQALFLHHKLQTLVIRRIRSPSRPWSQVDEMVVRAVVAVLSAEEQLINPSLYIHQRRTRPGIESGPDSRGRVERPRPVERFSPSRERFRDSNGSSPFTKKDRSSSPQGYHGTSSSRSVPQHSEKLNHARYFIMKCNNQRNLDISMSKNIWATTLANEKKLNRAFKETRHVFLIFSVQGSGHFQGYAQMTSSIGKDKSPEFGSSSLSGVFNVEWIKKASIPFQYAHHLVNPWNDHKKVQISRDGQELEPKVGGELCKLWDTDLTNPSGRVSRSNTTPATTSSSARKGKPPTTTQLDTHPSPSQWQGIQPNLGYPAVQQVYTTHTPSMPIPVPIPPAHSRHTIPTAYPNQHVTPQPMAVHPQTSVPFAAAAAAALQPQFRPQAARFPGAVVQSQHLRGMGRSSHFTRGAFNPPRK